MAKYNYNLRPSTPDERDFKVMPINTAKLPSTVDLRPLCPPVYDQGQLGSCTGNAGCAANTIRLAKQDKKNLDLMFSRLYLYYKERSLEGTISEDAGAQMRDICKALNKFGVCLESTIPYDITKFADTPSAAADTEAAKYKISTYSSLTDVNHIKAYLATQQQPVLMGMQVYDSFESDAVASNGIVPLPKRGEQLLGGHAVLIVGYKDANPVKEALASLVGKPAGYFIVRNSWGPDWGDKGYFYLPYEFVTKKLAYDFWVIA